MIVIEEGLPAPSKERAGLWPSFNFGTYIFNITEIKVLRFIGGSYF